MVTKNQPAWELDTWDYKITPVDVRNLNSLHSLKSKLAGSFTIIEPQSLYLNSSFPSYIDLFVLNAIQTGLYLLLKD